MKHSEPYFVLLICGLLVLAVLRWCFGPHSHLPRFRVRYLRLRLHLRLHPGRGHASVFELWLRWGRLAAFRRSGRSRPSLPVVAAAGRSPDEHSACGWAGRSTGTGCAVPLEEHLLIDGPAADLQDRACWPASSCTTPARWSSTTTKHDVFQLTSGIRSRLRPGARVQPAAGRRGAVDVPVEPGRTGARTRRRRSAAPTGSRTRSTCPAPRTPRSGPARPPTTCGACSTPPRWRAGTCGWSPGGRWAAPSPPRTILAQAGAGAVGRRAGRAARRGAEDRRDDQDGAVPGAGVHDRPGAGPLRPARRRRRRRGHRGVPRRVRDAVPDRRVRARRQPGRPAVRRHGRRDPLRRRPGRAGHAAAGGWTRRC